MKSGGGYQGDLRQNQIPSRAFHIVRNIHYAAFGACVVKRAGILWFFIVRHC